MSRYCEISQGLLLSLYEGKWVDFEVLRGEHKEIVRGKIIRSGYIPVQPSQRLSWRHSSSDMRSTI